MKCEICSRETQLQPLSKYCEMHQKAYENLQQKFKAWERALNIDWKGYLAQVSKNPFTGKWVKEVAENLLSETCEKSNKRNV